MHECPGAGAGGVSRRSWPGNKSMEMPGIRRIFIGGSAGTGAEGVRARSVAGASGAEAGVAGV